MHRRAGSSGFRYFTYSSSIPSYWSIVDLYGHMPRSQVMPLSEEHRRNRSKNLTMLGILVAVAVLFFVVTLVKLTGG